MRGVVASLVFFFSALVTGPSNAALAADETKIVVEHFMFTPMSLTTHAGTTVVWINRDEEAHTVTSDGGLFRSGGLDTNQSFSFKFEKPGTYHFTCSLHPYMVGTIVVL